MFFPEFLQIKFRVLCRRTQPAQSTLVVGGICLQRGVDCARRMITRSVKPTHDSNGDSKLGGLQFSDGFIKKTKLWFMWPPMLWIVVTGRQLILSTLHNFNCPFHRDGHQFRICNPTNWPNSWDFLQRSIFTISLFSGPELQNTPHGFRRS